MRFPSVTLRLSGWVGGLILDPDRTYPNAEDRTRLAVELSREGSHRGKWDLSEERSSTGRRTSSSPPVPRPRCKLSSCPRLLLCSREDGGDHGHPPARWGLRPGREEQPPYELVASTEPCSMCFGAVPWFGVRHLVRGARGEDAEAAGFDKGPKPAEWVRTLEEPSITVERDVLRNEAAAVLRETAKKAASLHLQRPPGWLEPKLLGECCQVAAAILCHHDEVLDADAAYPWFVEAGLYRHHVPRDQLLVDRRDAGSFVDLQPHPMAGAVDKAFRERLARLLVVLECLVAPVV